MNSVDWFLKFSIHIWSHPKRTWASDEASCRTFEGRYSVTYVLCAINILFYTFCKRGTQYCSAEAVIVRRAAIVFRSTASSLTLTRHGLRTAAVAKHQCGYCGAGRVCERAWPSARRPLLFKWKTIIPFCYSEDSTQIRWEESYVYGTVHHLYSWVKRNQLDATYFIIYSILIQCSTCFGR